VGEGRVRHYMYSTLNLNRSLSDLGTIRFGKQNLGYRTSSGTLLVTGAMQAK
jgi:hypothetical protein